MNQRVAFQKLRVYADSQDFSPEQVESVTKVQVMNHLDLTDMQVREFNHFWPGMFEILMRDSLERQLQERLTLFRIRMQSVHSKIIFNERVKELAMELLPYLYGEV